MRFHYTKHVQKRIRQRELTADMLEQTVASPDQVQPTYKGRHLAQKRFHGKLLEVVYKEEEKRIVLITAYLLKKERG